MISNSLTHSTAGRRITIALLLVIGLGGCFGGKNDRDLRSGAEEIFKRGTKAMNSGNYRNAIAYYEALEARFPFSNEAKQAQLNLIYCYYKNGEPESAVDSAIQFERENPTHPRVDYALYMRGLANFRGQHNFFHNLFNVELAMRPPVLARESFSAFSRLIQRYPDSIYAPDAQQRMIFLRNRLAEHENYVAKYYLERGAYVAALNRARFSIENYDGAPTIADSLTIMMESYKKLGMQDLADDTQRILRESYPESLARQEKKKKRFLFF